jgi:MtN3 and saliva related transmembrane protein
MTDIFAILATITGITSSFAYYFQIFKILRTQSAKDLSVITFSIWAITNLTWLIYGILISNWPIIITDGVALIGAISLLVLWRKYRK